MKTQAQTQFLLGLIVGAAAGAALGFLLAPEKGTENQQKLKKGVASILDNLSQVLSIDKTNQNPEDNTKAHIEGLDKTKPS